MPQLTKGNRRYSAQEHNNLCFTIKTNQTVKDSIQHRVTEFGVNIYLVGSYSHIDNREKCISEVKTKIFYMILD